MKTGDCSREREKSDSLNHESIFTDFTWFDFIRNKMKFISKPHKEKNKNVEIKQISRFGSKIYSNSSHWAVYYGYQRLLCTLWDLIFQIFGKKIWRKFYVLVDSVFTLINEDLNYLGTGTRLSIIFLVDLDKKLRLKFVSQKIEMRGLHYRALLRSAQHAKTGFSYMF
jgi:hypothetical protein